MLLCFALTERNIMTVAEGGVGEVLYASAPSPGGRVVRYAPLPHCNFTSTFAKRLWGFRAVDAAQWNESQNIWLCSEERCIMSVNTGDP